ncbi:PAS domain-containing protein [Ramlibacter pallidus]|uniref:histidine kinase n=1 Tax=Ramlibacter pallidus TaxID=2780087 RepID=A0ABR9RZL2_9BURK|nr:PAS domain-containing protein [Ramlibacter pallidus]MBE7366487.1 PAS domain-containing protein [Ramlibacter pallidus]
MTDPSGTSLFGDPGLLVRAIAEATDDVIFAKDLQGRYHFANPATLAAVACTAEQVLGRTDLEFMHDQELARRIMATDREVMDRGQATELEETLRTTDGRLTQWHSRKMPLRDADGTLVGLLGIARDITERKAAEAQREASRLKLEMGVQAAGLVMAEIDYFTNENHISAELARLLELGDEDMVVPRQAIFDRIHPEDRDRYLREIARTLDPAGNGHLAINVRALVPSGAVRWLHIRLQIVFAEAEGMRVPRLGICAARDVTTEMVAESRLRAAQRLTESVIEGAGALVYAKDLQGRYILSNQAWRALHGLAPDQTQGVTDAELFGPEHIAEMRANDEKVAASGEPVLVQERVLLRGQHVTFRSSKFPLYDEAGRVYAVCGVSTDITDVVEADRRKDEFIATLAHELRNPLAPIRTGLEILRRVGELPPPAARTRDMMERQLTHLVRLVDDLLDVSRVSRGKLELRTERLDVEQVLNHAIEASQPSVDAAGHVLALDLPPEPLVVRGDLTRLAQVFSNLVNNASKYTPRGGRIDVQVRRDAGRARIAVTDNGSGIAAEVLPQVFDLFAQGSQMAHGGQGGLGIGLWLVRRLVELHHGTIMAHSDGPGRGSTFTVRLPLAD